MATTKTPTGLSILRSKNVITFSWKTGDADHDAGQWFQQLLYSSKTKSWPKSSTKIPIKERSRKITLNLRNYYPYTNNYLHRISFRIKGKRKQYKEKGKNVSPAISAFATRSFVLHLPLTPSLSMTKDEELTNRCVFSWSAPNSDTDTQILSDVEWQSMLVRNSNETNGSKLSWNNQALGWQTGTGVAASSKTITEDTSILYKNGDSHIRWFRVRARGPKGVSSWRYAYRVYAIPHQAQVTALTAQETESAGFQCSVDWVVESSRQYPIDKTLAQYTVIKPDKGLECPSGASWTDVDIAADTAGTDSATFSIDDQLSEDECLFIRINTQHDTKITYGKPTIASVGFLKNPSSLSVVSDPETHKARITATNNSEVEDSVLVVRYIPAKGEPVDVGIIPHGESEIIVQCPNWSDQTSFAFSVYAMVGSYIKQERTDGVDSYSVTPLMVSRDTIFEGGDVPVAPKSVTVSRVDGRSDTIRVTWDWTWQSANGAEISWADHDDAWESTDEPETYTISNMHASRWNISGLEIGKTWYVRVRLFTGGTNGQGATYGPWSDIRAGIIDLSSAPNKPVLSLSNQVISEEGSVTASWVYTTTDKTNQAYAEIALVDMRDIELPPERASEADVVIKDTSTGSDIYIKKERVYTNIIAHSETLQHVTIDAQSAGWLKGQTYNLACRVQSASGRLSEWSEIASITVADPLVCEITQTSLTLKTETETAIDPDTGQEITVTREYLALTVMPLTVTVTGAGQGGITSVELQRASDYHLMRPDENDWRGYEGEIVATQTQTGEEQLTFDLSDLIGTLDDGATYKIVATVRDGLGQKSSTELEFEVQWDHQARIPSAIVELDKDRLIAKITPIAPEGSIPSDVADIYRLSIDKPELVVRAAVFGETYVDPYPALGDMGGYRIVLRTENGDYITPDNTISMIDSFELEGSEYLENSDQLNIIDYEGRQIRFYYDTDYSNTWAKDFQETQYLGGSIQGDWNAAVSRSGTLSTQAITVLDQTMLQDVRRLAEYPGLCHVRTADGSSYTADVQVSEDRVHDEQEMLANYSLSITRVNNQGFDGITLDQWEQEQSEGGN